MNRRLFRSPDDRVLAGVAGGIAETYDLDPALVRVGWVLLALLTGGVFLLIYIVMAFVVPLRPAGLSLWAAAAGPEGMAPGGMAPGGMGPGGLAPGGGPEPGTASDGSSAGMPGGPPYVPGYDYSPQQRGRRERSNAGPLVIGIILIIVGGYFLLRQFVPSIDLGLIWPLLAIGGGVLLIVAAITRR